MDPNNNSLECHDSKKVEDVLASSSSSTSSPMDVHGNNSNNNCDSPPPATQGGKFQPLDIDTGEEEEHVRLNARLLEHVDDDEYSPVGLASELPSTPTGDCFIDWLFPPNLPRACQLLRLENMAIPLSYLFIGLLQGLSGILLDKYLLGLNTTFDQQFILSSIKSVPSKLKIVFGFLSDNFAILGYRRKSYMMVGWTLTSISLLGLLLKTIEHPPSGANDPQDSLSGPKSISGLAISNFLFGMGFSMAEVMGDSIVVEKAKLEPPHASGTTQAGCLAYRLFGLMIAVRCSFLGPGLTIFLTSALSLGIMPMIYLFNEVQVVKVDHPLVNTIPMTTTATTSPANIIDGSSPSSLSLPPVTARRVIPSTRDQCWQIWNTLCGRAVWQSMGFVFLFNVLQVYNGAWSEFLRERFGDFAYLLLEITSYRSYCFGILTYRCCMIRWSWRTVYIVTIILGGFFRLLQVRLINDTTSLILILGDETFSQMVNAIQLLITTTMMMHLCPTGSEGATYAMFKTASNSASDLSSDLSSHLWSIWDNVSREALANHQLTGFANLTYLTTVIPMVGILFVVWLPKNKEDLLLLNQSTQPSSIAGAIFLIITFGSVLYGLWTTVSLIYSSMYSDY